MSSDSNVLVGIHGYSPEGMEGGKDPETVWRDRLSKGLEVVRKLEKMDVDLSVAISGAGDYGGKTEAEMIKEFAEEEFQELTDNYEVIEEMDPRIQRKTSYSFTELPETSVSNSPSS